MLHISQNEMDWNTVYYLCRHTAGVKADANYLVTGRFGVLQGKAFNPFMPYTRKT